MIDIITPIPISASVLDPRDDTPGMTILRAKLRIARDIASRGLGDWDQHTIEAHQIFGIIAALASRHVCARVGPDTLRRAVDTCRRLLVSANAIDAIEGAGR
ncbi:MAG: hypothetical protein ACRYG4_09195 [Janthinobacterium lividum]